MEQIEVKVYLKKRIRPIATAILSSEKQLNEFKDELTIPKGPDDFVDFYEIIIKRSEIKYVTIRRIK